MAREFCFPVEVDWENGRRTTARVEGKPPLTIATPLEFYKDAEPQQWSRTPQPLTSS